MKNDIVAKAHSLSQTSYSLSLWIPTTYQGNLAEPLRESASNFSQHILKASTSKNLKQQLLHTRVALTHLKEARYLIFFSHKLQLIREMDYIQAMRMCEDMGKILDIFIEQNSHETDRSYMQR